MWLLFHRDLSHRPTNMNVVFKCVSEFVSFVPLITMIKIVEHQLTYHFVSQPKLGVLKIIYVLVGLVIGWNRLDWTLSLIRTKLPIFRQHNWSVTSSSKTTPLQEDCVIMMSVMDEIIRYKTNRTRTSCLMFKKMVLTSNFPFMKYKCILFSLWKCP